MGWDRAMNVTELDEVQALLERVMPDPTGFAQRLLLQAMARWGQSAATGGTPATASATAENVTASDPVMSPGQYGWDETPVDTNLLLAAALGACECWGLQPNCGLCQGIGSSGWT